MSLEQRDIDFFASGGTAPPERIPLLGEEEFSSKPAYWFGESQLQNVACRRPCFFIVSSGTSAEAVGLVTEGFRSHVPYGTVGALSGTYFGGIDQFKGRNPIKHGSLIRDVGFITEAGDGDETTVAYDYTFIPKSGYVVGLTVISGGTALVERRHRDSAAAIAQRAQQREKNKPAIALLETWLAEESDVASEAASLKETIEALNAERSQSRKLFP
jgi:hypothetical protein